MTTTLRCTLGLMLGLGVMGPGLGCFAAENSPPVTQPVATAEPKAPFLPAPKSPLDSFRRMLLMKPAERERALASRPEKMRQLYLEKLQEYDALQPDERELRLRLTELSWYLASFMRTPATNRAGQLATMPEKDRQMVAERIQRWDGLTPDQQKDVLNYQAAMRAGTNSGAVLSAPTVKAQDDSAKKLEDWNKLPPAQRGEMYRRFQQFFELSPEEKEKTLHVLSVPERQQMEKAITRFEQLPAARRQKFLENFPSFTGMSDAERNEFLRNAEHWEEMSPSARQAWRVLVSHLPPPPPPMPPGFGPPMPPMHSPAPLRMTGSQPLVPLASTNGVP